VRLGYQNLKTKTDNADEIDINIMEFIKHPQHSYKLSKNDIALVKLEQSVRYIRLLYKKIEHKFKFFPIHSFSKYLRPACLWQSSFFNFTKAIATGQTNK
jgi:hypothetical protein